MHVKKKIENTGHLQMLKNNAKSMLKKDRKHCSLTDTEI